MPSPQETFDAVARHLLTQGRPAAYRTEHGYTTCRYRQECDGVMLKCALGVLIPDDEMDHKFEGNSASYPAITKLIAKLEHNYELVVALQNAHDFAAYDVVLHNKNWTTVLVPRLDTIARRYGLSEDVLKPWL